jgi:ankyrin repeat protein
MGSTCLHICAERDFQDILKLLCAKRQDLIFQEDEGGNTPLHIASLSCHMEIIEYLWEEGGKKLVEVKNKEGKTAYELAYEENQIYAYEFLCDKMGIKTNSFCSLL